MNFVVLIQLELVLLEDKVEVIVLQKQLGIMLNQKGIKEMDGKMNMELQLQNIVLQL